MYDADQRSTLIEIAERSIVHRVQTGSPMRIDSEPLGSWAAEPRATFVTVNLDGKLHGCIGTMQPVRPLAEDVAANAWRAAVNDPRFPPLLPEELDGVSVHLSVLGPLTPMTISGEQDLLEQLRPATDGLLIDDGVHRATFLPAVWKKIEDAEQFLLFLKRKAGVPHGTWPHGMRAFRYEVEEFDRTSIAS